tara:strand:- start:764 stop:1357 length:594 start_codon:yes stop_codon:yes gene_type:complete
MTTIVERIKQLPDLVGKLALPLFASFIIMMSIFKADMKGVVFLAMSLIPILLNEYVFKQMFATPIADGVDNVCNLYNMSTASEMFSRSTHISNVFMGFTIAYFLLTMILYSNIQIGVLVLLLVFYISDLYFVFSRKCVSPLQALIGSVVGITFGVLTTIIMYFLKLDNYMYFADDDVQEKKKISVYKDGELIKQIIR